MKKILIFIVLALVLIGGFFITRGEGAVIGNSATITKYLFDGEPTGKALVSIPFLKDFSEALPISIWADFNTDSIFSDEERIVTDIPTDTQKDWQNGYYVALSSEISETVSLRIRIGEYEKDITANVATEDVGPLFDIESVTNPEEAMKGVGVQTAYAQNTLPPAVPIPDLNQRPAECAPTAAANNLISLVDRYGGEDLIPGDPNDFIENLKRHMNWTPENGVPPDDFVEGKNKWAAAAGVPIRTEKVGDTHGVSTLPAIRDGLQKGGAVEIRIKLANAEGTQVLGGHMVTVTNIREVGGKTYLDINDPATHNSGTETVELRNNQLVNYGPWRGITLLSWGFVQIWEGHPTGELLDTMTDAEIQGIQQFVGDEVTVKVIEYQGDHIQISQLRVGDVHPPHAEGEGCPEKHWHADGPVTSLEGRTFTDPNAGGCGFGTLSQKPSQDYTIPNLEEAGSKTNGVGIEIRGLENLKAR